MHALTFILILMAPAPVAAQIDVIDQPGSMKVEPLYLGQPLASLSQTLFNFVCEVKKSGVIANGSAISDGQSAVTFSLQAGGYTVATFAQLTGAVLTAETAVTVSPNTLTTYQPEMSASMGLVSGILNINGALPPAGVYNIGVSANSTSIGASGYFRFLLPAGNHVADVSGPSGVLKQVSFTITAGQELNLGTVAVVDAQGSLTIQPLYQSQPLSTMTDTQFNFVAEVRKGGAFFDGTAIGPGQASITYHPQAGAYTVATFAQLTGATLTPPAGVTVVANTLTTFQPEMASAMGLVKGILKINGISPPADIYRIQVSASELSVSSSGTFRFLLPAGNHTADVRGPTGLLQQIPFTITAGQELNLGNVNVVDAQGTLQIAPKYLGQPLSSTAAYNFVAEILKAGIVQDGGAISNDFPTYQKTLQAGPYSVRTYTQWTGITLTPATGVNVAANTTTTYSPEMSASMGLVRGVVRVNGVLPPPGQYRVEINVSSQVLGSNGAFRFLLNAGNHTGYIYGPTGLLATFQFTVQAGKEIDLGNPGAMNFLGTIARSGTQAARTWIISLRNTGTNSFLNVTGKLILTQSAGTPTCTPVISAPNPVTFGDIVAGATIQRSFVLNFTGCPVSPPANAAKFRVELQVTSGTNTTTFTLAKFDPM
jgi:uncharacterized protein YegP (UPF0339 family)